MESEIALTSIFILMLVVTATAKSALDELSDVALRLLATETARHASFWRAILSHYQQFRFTLTFGIHLSIASIAILISSIALALYPHRFIPVAFIGMLLTVILFRQIVPLLIIGHDPARTLLWLRWPLRLLSGVLGLVADPIYRMLRRAPREDRPATEAEIEKSADDNDQELQAFLDVGAEEGIIEQSEGEMIQSIIRFSDRTVVEVMTPRTNIVAVAATVPLEQVRDLMIESKYSRLPVYREQIDNIEGVIYVRDLLKYWQSGELAHTAIELARPTYFVPATKPIDELLPEMQKAKAQMAIVIDEYGGLAGLVTLEDLVEEIVGEIEDEDEPEPHATEADIVDESDEASIVRGQVEIGKIERKFNIELAADDFTTIAGLVINQLGHLPVVGEWTELRGLRFEVVEADERRVSRVRITRLSQSETEELAEVGIARGEQKRNGKF